MKKALSLMLTAVVSMGILAGCSKPANNEPKDLSGEKPTLRQLGFQRNFDPNADPVAKFLEEETGYKVNYEILPLEGYDDKLNLLMANKEEIDIVKLSASQYNRLANEGALEPLDDLLKNYGQTLLKVNSKESFETAKVDGVTYGIPEKAPRPFANGGFAVRKDVLAKVGLPMPKTIDEFYNFLKAIKEKTDMIPLTGFEHLVYEIAGAFGVVTQWEDNNGQVINRIEDPGMVEYLKFMNKLYKEGLIDSEWPINNSAKAQEKFTGGKAAMMTYGWGLGAVVTNALEKNFPGVGLDIILGLEGKDGQKGSWTQATGVSWYIAIPKASKNKEHAMKYLDLKVQPDTFEKLAIGVEGTHWEKDANGKIVPILPTFNDERGNADWFITSTDQKAYEDLWLVRTRKDKIIGETFEKLQAMLEYGKVDLQASAPPLPVNAKYNQKLLTLEKDYILKAIAGTEDLANYNKFIEQWKSEGGTEAKEEMSTWYKSKK